MKSVDSGRLGRFVQVAGRKRAASTVRRIAREIFYRAVFTFVDERRVAQRSATPATRRCAARVKRKHRRKHRANEAQVKIRRAHSSSRQKRRAPRLAVRFAAEAPIRFLH
ncbi:hypothetical protein I6G56_10365 [Burkholderia humptydooensis]|uniref:Uncharacterized protein n=1 Tax=Burkholderia humptydooensis TaxID=430531 RepID=A0A7T2U4D8_9BURK|nr:MULTISPECIES: hypothetical protein [Burkholderia]QPS45421.1 hypothetical protein I6G56_10365 [Burkholderia humptydooensis]